MRRPRVILVMAIQFAGCQAGAPSGASVARTLLTVYHRTVGQTVLGRLPNDRHGRAGAAGLATR